MFPSHTYSVSENLCAFVASRDDQLNRITLNKCNASQMYFSPEDFFCFKIMRFTIVLKSNDFDFLSSCLTVVSVKLNFGCLVEIPS